MRPLTQFSRTKRRTSVVIQGCVAVLVFAADANIAQSQDPDAGVLYHPSQVLVAFQPATVAAARDAAHVAAQAVGLVREYHIVQGLQLVEVPEGQIQQALTAYRNNPSVLLGMRAKQCFTGAK